MERPAIIIDVAIPSLFERLFTATRLVSEGYDKNLYSE